MADVKMIDIADEQWEIKDQVARNQIAEHNTLISENAAQIQILKNNSYINKEKQISRSQSASLWIKLSNLYPDRPHANNIFIVSTRSGGFFVLSCGTTDNIVASECTLIKFLDPHSKLQQCKFYNRDVYLYITNWNISYIQQIYGMPVDILFTTEEPPSTATEITIKEIQY